MIVYRSATRRVSRQALRAQLQRTLAQGDAVETLVMAGEAEQAAIDALAPERDRWGPVEQRFRALTLAAARSALADAGGSPAPALEVDAALWVGLPAQVVVHAPEGFVHYGLDPLAYGRAAAAYASDAGARRARQALVVGVRSIGTALSAVVTAAVGAETTVTVRPRGKTGSRRVVTDAPLEQVVREALARGGDALVVDEGPGATGETFACVADWLTSLGTQPGRIVLFPSRRWGMPLAPEARQIWFEGARKYVDDALDRRPAQVGAALGLGALEDLSAGQWRNKVPGAVGAPVNRWHERTKYRAVDGSGRRWLIRYGGLGTWGQAAAQRASVLAEAELGPEVRERRAGFLVVEWVEGEASAAATREALVEPIARYLERRAPLFHTGETVDRAPVLEMLRENACEALGGACGVERAINRLAALPAREAVVADARLLTHEWVRTVSREGGEAERYVKVDAVDHGDTVRLPGPTDLAWDVAGAAIELRLGAPTLDTLVARVAAAARQAPPELTRAVAAYRAPYAALCLGEAQFAAWEAAPGADRQVWEREVERYRTALADELRSDVAT